MSEVPQTEDWLSNVESPAIDLEDLAATTPIATLEDFAPRTPPVAVENALPRASKKSWPKLALRIGITGVLLAFLVRSVSWSTLQMALGRIYYSYFFLGLSAGVVCVLFSAYGWRTLVLAERIRTDLAHLINLYLVGIAFSHFLPTSMGGDTVKAFYVGTDSGNMAGSASAVLMSRITSFMGMLLIALPALVLLHADFTHAIILWFSLLSLLLIGAMSGAIVLAAVLPSLSARFFLRGRAQSKVFTSIVEVGNALYAASKRPVSLGVAMIYGVLFWLASFLNYYGYAVALGLHVPLTFYIVAIPFVSIVAALPISINGFGVREGAFVYIFSTIHVPSTMSLLLAFLMDAQVLCFGIIGGCIYLTMGMKVPKREV